MKLGIGSDGGTPPWRRNSNNSTPMKVTNGNGGDEGPEDVQFSMFSLVKRTLGGDDNDPDDHDNGGPGGNNDRQDPNVTSRDDRDEFQLVNSTNIEIAKYVGTMGCKIYIDFNDRMRNYIGYGRPQTRKSVRVRSIAHCLSVWTIIVRRIVSVVSLSRIFVPPPLWASLCGSNTSRS